MDIIEAIKQLKNGEKIRNSKWGEGDKYIELNEFGKLIKADGEYCKLCINGIFDLVDNDWEIYKPLINDKNN